MLVTPGMFDQTEFGMVLHPQFESQIRAERNLKIHPCMLAPVSHLQTLFKNIQLGLPVQLRLMEPSSRSLSSFFRTSSNVARVSSRTFSPCVATCFSSSAMRCS